MKNINLIYFLIIYFVSSCGCDVNTEFDAGHISNFNLYHEGDTIYFENDIGLMDTIVIVKKSEWVNNCMLSYKSIEIKHLPKNNWIDGYEANFKPLNQSVITIEKEIAPKGYDQFSEYSTYIAYRNFHGQLLDSMKSIQNQLFNDFGLNKYIQIKNDRNDKDSLDVSEIFWSNNFGIIGYRLNNGNLFKMKKQKMHSKAV